MGDRCPRPSESAWVVRRAAPYFLRGSLAYLFSSPMSAVHLVPTIGMKKT
jgi:hypothetical protein